MAFFAPSGSSSYSAAPARIRAVSVTASDSAAAVVSVYDGQDTGAVSRVVVKAPIATTQQVVFEGLPFSSGFTVVLSGVPDFVLVDYLPGVSNAPA